MVVRATERIACVSVSNACELTGDDGGGAVLLLVFFCGADVERPPVFEVGESLLDGRNNVRTFLFQMQRNKGQLLRRN